MNKLFEDYLCGRNDLIDNTCYELICALTAADYRQPYQQDNAIPEWDMAIIGEANDAVKQILHDMAIHVCHPYYCNDVPCYLAGDCDNPHCLFKSQKNVTPVGGGEK